MTDTVFSIIPDPQILLGLEPEELAGVVMEVLNASAASDSWILNAKVFCSERSVKDYPEGYHGRISEALMEAWVWLEREGLIAPRPSSPEGWFFITRRGTRIRNTNDLAGYRRANLLPKTLLHPVIAQKVWSAFLRGEYDTAVFQAFKEVEVAVRDSGHFSAKDFGVDLMRRAFDKSTGPLTDSSLPEAEKEAMSHLFAGAIGLYKNSQSHRNVSIDAGEAVALIILASHLLQIVDSRSASP